MQNSDEDLLFGLVSSIAVVDPAGRFAEATASWLAQPAGSLREQLQKAGVLSPLQLEFVDKLVAHSLQAHGGDASAALAALGGKEALDQSIGHGQGATAEQPAPGESGQTTEAGLIEQEGRYKTLHEIGRGGVGRVLLVHDTYLGRDVALKELIPPAGRPDDETSPMGRGVSELAMARFLQEARITSQLEHPAAPPIHELGRRANGSLYYTMKCVRGRTLRRAINDAGSLEQRLALLPHFVDLCQALAYAHDQSIIHRDIKPDNVMVGEFGETIVLDWGLAKLRGAEDVHREPLETGTDTHGDSTKTLYGQVLGTPAYMAPEQAKGAVDAIDERSDLYGLGAVLYTILAGRPPFQAQAPQDVVRQVLEDEPDPIDTLEPAAPKELIAVCKKAMAKAPNERYASAKELADEVQRFQTGALVSAHAYTLRDYARWFWQRYKWPVVGTAAAVLLLAATATAYSVQLIRTNERLVEAREEEQEQRLAAEQTAEELAWENYAGTIAIVQQHLQRGERPRALELLYNTADEHRGWEWGYLRRRASNALWSKRRQDWPDPISGMPAGLFVAPNERYLLVVNFFNAMKHVYDIKADRTIFAKKIGDANAWLGCSGFTPDSEAIYTAPSLRAVVLWDFRKRERQGRFEAAAGELRQFCVSHGGTRAAGFIKTPDGRGEIIVWDVSSGDRVRQVSLRRLPDDWEHPRIKNETWSRFHAHHGGVWGFFENDARLAFSDTHLGVLNVATGEVTRYAKCFQGVAFRPRRGLAAMLNPAGTVETWNLKTGRRVAVMETEATNKAAAGPSYEPAFSKDGRWVYSLQDPLRAWNANSGEPIRRDDRYGLESAEVFGGGRLYAGIRDHRPDRPVQIRDLHRARVHESVPFTAESGEPVVEKFQNTLNWPPAYAFEPEHDCLLTGGNEGYLNVWSIPSFRRVRHIKAHVDKLRWCDLGPDGKRLASTAPETIKVFDYATEKLLWSATNPKGTEIWGCAFAADGKRLAYCYGDPSADSSEFSETRVVDLDTGKEVFTVSGKGETLRFVDYSPDGRFLIVGAYGQPEDEEDPSAYIWDAETGTHLYGTINSMNWLWGVDFSPDNTRMLAVGLTREPVMWDLNNHRERYRLEGANVWQVRFHPSGVRFLGASEDGRIKVFASKDGRELLDTGRGQFPAAFSKDGKRLIHRSQDGKGMTTLRTDPWKVGGREEDMERRRKKVVELLGFGGE